VAVTCFVNELIALGAPLHRMNTFLETGENFKDEVLQS